MIINGGDVCRGNSLVMFIFLLGLIGCSKSVSPELPTYRIEDSFESGMSSWTTHSLDDKVDTVTIDWYFVSSDERASDGSHAAKLFMDNRTDAAKIWLQQALDVAPNKSYYVTIRFALASRDHGDINLFAILANVLPQEPLARDDVLSGVLDGDFPEGTYNGGIDDFVWLDKSLTKTVRSGGDGKLFFILGIWGTWETARTYYFDDLKITVSQQS